MGKMPILNFFPGGASFAFGNSDASELGIGEKSVGEITVLDGLVFSLDEVGVDDLVVVIGNVGECRTALDIAERPNSRDVGFHSRIGFNIAAIVRGDSGFGQIQIGGVGLAAGSNQKMRAGDRLAALWRVECKRYFAATILDLLGLRGQLKFNAFGFEDFLQLSHDVFVFAGQNTFAAVDDGYLAAEAAKHLSEFEADVAAAQDQQMLGNFLQIHDRDVGEERHGIEAGDGRNLWVGAGVDEDFFAFESFVPDLHLMRADESSAAVNQANVRAAVDSFLNGIAKTLHDTIFSGDDLREVDGYFTYMNAPARGLAGVVSDLSGGDQGFRGRAAGVDARAAELGALDESDFPAQVGEGVGQRLVGLTGADGDRVEFHGRLPTDAPAYERLVYPDFCQRKGAWRRKPGVKIESRFGAQQIRIYAWPGDGKAKG